MPTCITPTFAPDRSVALPPQLTDHLRASLGSWPPPDGHVRITTSAERHRPSWDGTIVTAMRLDTPSGSVLSAPAHLLNHASHPATVHAADRWMRAALPWEHWQVLDYRWCGADDPVADFDDAGAWVPHGGSVPDWLRPFNGGVLVATVHGEHAAAVGIKRHDRHAHEIAVVTSAAHQERGLARRLVAQATRAIHTRDAVALYLHAPDNEASRRVANHVGFGDHGWQLISTGS